MRAFLVRILKKQKQGRYEVKYNKESCAVELTAKELCLLALRCGDLGGYAFDTGEWAKDEENLYYKLQSEAGAYYNPDVELSNTVFFDGIYFTVSTFADGIIRKNGKVTVDKIKCTKKKGVPTVPDAYSLAMLKCAAYFISVRDSLRTVEGRISYYNTATKKLRYFKCTFLFSELKEFYLSLVEKVKFRAVIEAERELDVLLSAQNVRFPYGELRDGQEKMIRESYSAIKKGKRIFLEAPTGTGKTISSLFPALKALGNGYCDKIFYLTPKAQTRREAFSAAAKLHGAGCLTRTVVISAKEQMCVCPSRSMGVGNCCNGKCCEFARGYYDRVDGALREMLQNYRGYSKKLIMQMAEKYRVCPYELSLDLSELCDVIICDYNYAFDPFVYFRRYFGAEGKNGKYVFLIDEAHDLADRARQTYSAEVHLRDFENIAVEGYEEINAMLSPAIAALKSIRRLCKDTVVKDEYGNERGFYISSELSERIDGALAAFSKKCSQWLSTNEEHPMSVRLYSLNSDVKRYLKISEYFDRNFKFFAEILGDDAVARIYCVDPSDIMDSLLTRATASVMFSATLTPTEYFCDVLGCGKGAERVSLESPFPIENLCVAVADYIDSRFESREDNAKKYATLIAATVSAKAGNYIAYFPSYKCLEQTYRAFSKKYPKVETVVQKKNMSAEQRDEFLSAFKEDRGHLRVGFCVLGGAFSEGVDLPGSRLIGSIIFGVGLPGLSNERNIVKEHFDLKSDEGIGYDYAYTFPGMNNVLQAAGRVIRREEDVGVVVLADDRYAAPKYRTLFPNHWQGVKYAGNASSVAEIMRRFWEKRS